MTSTADIHGAPHGGAAGFDPAAPKVAVEEARRNPAVQAEPPRPNYGPGGLFSGCLLGPAALA